MIIGLKWCYAFRKKGTHVKAIHKKVLHVEAHLT